jgi:hypothetical protein
MVPFVPAIMANDRPRFQSVGVPDADFTDSGPCHAHPGYARTRGNLRGTTGNWGQGISRHRGKRTGNLPDEVKDMSELSHLLEFRGGTFTVDMFASPAVQAAYRVMLEGDIVEAETRFRRLIDENPRDHEALAGLAVCTAEDGGRFLTAEKLAQQSVRLAPKSAAGYIALGYIHLRGSRLEEGYRYLMKAKHLAPRDPRLSAGFALYDRERPPVIADLSRLHPVNKVLGGVRTGLRSPAQRAMGLACLAVTVYMASTLIG